MASMKSVVISAYSEPSGYQLDSVARPEISDAADVLIRVHASSINPIDVKKASGAMKMAVQDSFPYKIGYDCAGVVVAVGSSVSKFKVGDEVYTRLPNSHKGSWCEYAICPESFIALKPTSMSFDEAAAVPLAAVTALQAFRKYPGSLAGKTIFVPGGLSGTGSYACQLAKNVFGAGKVITTVSTSKVSKVAELIGSGIVDEVIDYTKSDPKTIIPAASIDFLYDTTGQGLDFLSRMVPRTGCIVSVAATPSGKQLKSVQEPGSPKIPFIAVTVLNTLDSVRKFRARRWKTGYEFLFLQPNGKDLEELSGYIDNGKVKSIIGNTVDFNSIKDIKEACMMSFQGKGGLGKTVIKMNIN